MAKKPLEKPAITYISMGPVPLYVGVAFDDKSFQREIKRLGIKEQVKFLDDTADACIHTFESDKGVCSILTFDPEGAKGKTKTQLAALFAHEAVHVLQDAKDAMNERKPGVEFEAYLVQYVTEQFILAYEEYQNG